MRIVFIGTVTFSQKALEKLISINANVVGVCTKEKSIFNSDFADLTPICDENNISYQFIDDINSKESIAWINNLKPDIIFCFGWSNLIKKELLDLAPLGVIGYHPASLPQNRGRHPLVWALALGLKESASTFFFMKEGADDGDILSQESFKILDEDDAKELYDKVIDVAINQIEDFVPELESKTYKRIKQNDTESNVWRKRGKRDGEIDFRMTSKAIYNLVRALSKPYVGAHLVFQEKDIIVWKVETIDCPYNNIESGKVLDSNNDFVVIKTYDGAIKLLEHEFSVLPKIGEYL